MPVITTTHASAPELIAVRSSIFVEPEWEAEVSAAGGEVDFGNIRIAVVYDETLRRFAVDAVTVQRIGEGSEVTGAMLRDIRVQERVQKSALMRMWIPFSGRLSTVVLQHNGQRLYPASAVLETFPEISGRATDADAINAASIYDIATVAYMPVLQTIGRVLNTSQSTAKRLIARAREMGALADGDD